MKNAKRPFSGAGTNDASEQIHLVIVGRHTEYTDKIERFIKENKLEERVHIISNVPFDDLPAFYQLAEILYTLPVSKVLVFPL